MPPDPISHVRADDALAVATTAAIHEGDVDRLARLLRENPGLATARIDGARTLLHVATDWPGHFPNAARTVALLIDAGADPNARMTPHPKDPNCIETPLHWAASSNDVAVLDALLDGGADIEASGAIFTGGPPMSDAVVFGQWQAARRLLDRGAQTTLWQAAALGLLDRVKEVCTREPSPSREEITNAFWNACRGGQLGAAQYLIDHGADAKWIGYDGKTPEQVAVESGNEELSGWLREKGGTMSSVQTRFEGIQPILRVEDMQVSLRFYVDVLGFSNASWGTEDFTSITREGGAIYLCRDDQGRGGAWLWIGVEDVEKLYQELKARGVSVLLEPTNYPWALEMRLQDPDGNVLRFGSEPKTMP